MPLFFGDSGIEEFQNVYILIGRRRKGLGIRECSEAIWREIGNNLRMILKDVGMAEKMWGC